MVYAIGNKEAVFRLESLQAVESVYCLLPCHCNPLFVPLSERGRILVQYPVRCHLIGVMEVENEESRCLDWARCVLSRKEETVGLLIFRVMRETSLAILRIYEWSPLEYRVLNIAVVLRARVVSQTGTRQEPPWVRQQSVVELALWNELSQSLSNSVSVDLSANTARWSSSQYDQSGLADLWVERDDLLHYFVYDALPIEVNNEVLVRVLPLSYIQVRGAVVDEENIGLAEVGVDIAVKREHSFQCKLSRNHIEGSSHERGTVFVAL